MLSRFGAGWLSNRISPHGDSTANLRGASGFGWVPVARFKWHGKCLQDDDADTRSGFRCRNESWIQLEVEMKMSNTYHYASGIFLATALAASPLIAEQNPNVQEGDLTGTHQASESERGLLATGATPADRSDKIDRVEVEDIVGKDVVNQSDDKIGNIEKIVRNQKTFDLHAVVSVGGFLGMGEKEVTIPLKDLEVNDDEIRAPQTASTEEQLKGLPQYDQSKFQALDDDQSIERSDFAAFESDDD